jgi:hypothetical protein
LTEALEGFAAFFDIDPDLMQAAAETAGLTRDARYRPRPSGYDRAAGLLCDLRALALEDGIEDDFSRRLASIRTRHERKIRFIERLLARGSGDETARSSPSRPSTWVPGMRRA